MSYYYPFIGQKYCINGVHYDQYGNEEGRHSDADEDSDDEENQEETTETVDSEEE